MTRVLVYLSISGVLWLAGDRIGALIWWMAALVTALNDRRPIMSGKRYHTRNPSQIPPEPFELEVWRNGKSEIHEFVARPQADAGATLMFTTSGEDGERKAQAVFRMMSRMLRDDDGVPAQWVPEPLPKPGNAGANWQPKFRGPDGKLYTMDKAPQFTEPAKGSSRRRWDHMMFEDDGVTVDIEVIGEILEDLVAVAAERPTVGSSPSA